MQLADWLRREKITRTEFGKRIGVSAQAITAFCEGSFWISKKNALRIFAETNGEVTPTDLMMARPANPKTESAA